MGTPLKLDINDKDGLIKAMNDMKPGDQIEVQGNASKMTIGAPSLEEESDVQSVDPPQRPQGSPDSWLS